MMKPRRVGGKISALASIFDRGVPSPSAPEEPASTDVSLRDDKNEWETFTPSSPKEEENSTLEAPPLAVPASREASDRMQLGSPKAQPQISVQSSPVNVTQPAAIPDNAMDESSAQDKYFQTLLSRSFSCLKHGWRQKSHRADCFRKISSKRLRSTHARLFLPWKERAAENGSLRRRCSQIADVREARELVGEMTYLRKILVTFNAYIRDKSRLQGLNDTLLSRHQKFVCCMVLGVWCNICRLKSVGNDICKRRAASMLSHFLAKWAEVRSRRQWYTKVTSGCQDRTIKFRQTEVLAAWCGRIGHRRHLVLVETKLVGMTAKQMASRFISKWLEWAMACIRGKHMTKVRYFRQLYHRKCLSFHLQHAARAAVGLQTHILAGNVVSLWHRTTKLAITSDKADFQRFARFIAAWSTESHKRVRLRRIKGRILSRRAIQLRVQALQAWLEYVKWRASLDALEKGVRMEREARQESRIMGRWLQVSWKKRVLRRAELLLRNKSHRSVMSSCLERWVDQAMQMKHESLLAQQKDERMARSTSAMVLVAWQRSVLYLKYLRLTEDKVAEKHERLFRRRALRYWCIVCKAIGLGRASRLRGALHDWKKAAWLSSCKGASKAVADELGRLRILRAVIHEWNKHGQEGKWCGSFRDRQILAGALRQWRVFRMRWKRYKQSEGLLKKCFVVDQGSKRLAWMLRQWLGTARSMRSISDRASPTLQRKKERLQRLCVQVWFRRARRSKLKNIVQEEMGKERAVKTKLRVLKKWSERAELARAIEETILENVQARQTDMKSACFSTWCHLRTYKIQLVSAAQYTEEVTAEYCMQRTITEWHAAVKYKHHVDKIERKIFEKASERRVNAHFNVWVDWIKACNSDVARCGRATLHLWKTESARKVYARSSKGVAARKRTHDAKNKVLKAWRFFSIQRKDVCKVTGLWDKREVALRRRALQRRLRAWLERVHRAAANRTLTEGLSIQVSRKLRVRAVKAWRLRVVTRCMHADQTTAVQVNAARGLLKRYLLEWNSVFKHSSMMVKFTCAVITGYGSNLGRKALSLWRGCVRKRLALRSVLTAVDQMYRARLSGQKWKQWLESLGNARVIETAEQLLSCFAARMVQMWAWSVWRDRIKWFHIVDNVMEKVCGKVRSKQLSVFASAWRQLCRAQSKGKRAGFLNALLTWADVARWLAFLKKAWPMSEKWHRDKVLRPIVQSWFMMTAVHRRYAHILQERKFAMKKRILPGCMHAWFVVASKREILASVSHVVWYKFSTGVRGRMFGKWRHFMYRNVFFQQVFFVLAGRHTSRVLRGCLRGWRDAKSRWQLKGRKLDAVEDVQDKFVMDRLVRIVRGWQQFVISNGMRERVIRRRLFLKIVPNFRCWLQYVAHSLRLKAASAALASVANKELLRRTADTWRKFAPFLRLLWLGEVIVGRRTTHNLLRSVITSWSKAVQALDFYTILLQRIIFRAWMRLALRKKFCKVTCLRAIAPRRKRLLLECTRSWRLVKEQRKYFFAAVDAMQESLRRRCSRRILKSWLLHVGYLRPKRLATFSAANLADVRRRLLVFQRWYKYASAKAARSSAARTLMLRR
jgi:hypothetical protein